MSLPSIILIPLLAGALLAAGWCLSKMLSGVGRGQRDAEMAHADGMLIDLEDAKLRLLLTLKDLEQDYAMGKLSEEDFEELKTRYEREVIQILDEISLRVPAVQSGRDGVGAGSVSPPQEELSRSLSGADGPGSVSLEEG